MSIINNQKIKCERSQIEQANIICQSCEPFHYFCPRCDSIVHAMRIRLSHSRQNINSNLTNNSLNSKSMSTNNCSNIPSKFEFNNPKSLNFLRINSPKNRIGAQSPNFYGEEFLNEVNRIHSKEIESLQYKINTLENNNERLKLNFQNEIKKMEERINNILTEKKNMEEKYNEILAINEKKLPRKNWDIIK